METKLHCDVMSRLKYELGYTHGVSSSSDGNSGDLAFLWKLGTEV